MNRKLSVNAIRRVAAEGLSCTRGREHDLYVLMYLCSKATAFGVVHEVTQAQMARDLDLTVAQARRNLDNLVDSGFVVRRADYGTLAYEVHVPQYVPKW